MTAPAAESLTALRERYVARGVSAPRLTVVRAAGARLWDDPRPLLPRLRGRHRLPEPRPRLRRVGGGDPRAGRPLPAPVRDGGDLRAVRRGLPALGGALAVRRARAEEPALELGRRGGRERGQDRAGGDRSPGRRRVRGRLPRPHAPDHDDDRQGRSLPAGIRPVRAGGLPGAGALPVPGRRERRGDRGDRASVRHRGRSRDGRLRRPRAAAGGGRLHRDAAGLPGPAEGAQRAPRHPYVDDEVQTGVGRTGRLWAIEHYDVAPDLLVTGKSLGGGLPLAAVTGSAEVLDAVPPGGLGGTFGGSALSCAAAVPVLDEVASPEFLARARELGERLRAGLEELAARVPAIGEVRGLGPMLALELVRDRTSKEPAAELAAVTIRHALDAGLVLLGCGLYGKVVRLLPPLVAESAEIDEGLAVLEASLVRAAGSVS